MADFKQSISELDRMIAESVKKSNVDWWSSGFYTKSRLGVIITLILIVVWLLIWTIKK